MESRITSKVDEEQLFNTLQLFAIRFLFASCFNVCLIANIPHFVDAGLLSKLTE